MIISIVYCPKCKTEMYVCGVGEYETLCDHVSNPNATHVPLRPMYTCPNKCNPEHSFYGVQGGWYSSSTKREDSLGDAWYKNQRGPLEKYFWDLLQKERKERGVKDWPGKYWETEYKIIHI